MKKIVLSSLAYIFVFSTLSHSTNNPITSNSTENIQNYSLHDKILNKFYKYFLDAQDPKHPPELNQKLANIQKVYEPYLKVIKSFSTEREIEVAISFIFTYEFHQYFSDTSTYLNDKLQYLRIKVTLGYLQDSLITLRNSFIKKLPVFVKDHTIHPLNEPFLKNYILEANLNAFYNFINQIFIHEKNSPLENKILKIKEVFSPYMPFLNDLHIYSYTPTAISLIFAYEYGRLLENDNSDYLKTLKEQIQPYIDAVKETEKEKDLTSYNDFIEVVSSYAHIIPTIIPNPLANSILKEVFEFFKSTSNRGFFSFNINPQKIEQTFNIANLNGLNSCFDKDSFWNMFNLITASHKMSHFNLFGVIPGDKSATSYGEHKNDMTYLKIPSFSAGYNAKKIQSVLTETVQKNNHLILDLRDNPGGLTIYLMHFLSFFIPLDTTLAYSLNKENQEFLDYEGIIKANCSPESLKVAIENLEKNWNKPERSFKMTIAQAKKTVEDIKAQYQHQPEKLEKDYKEKQEDLKYLKKLLNLDLNFNNERMKGKIAILYNSKSMSCSQLATFFLKTFLPERVKTIKCNILYEPIQYIITPAVYDFLPQSKLYIQYPINEIITLDFKRLEGQLQKSDIYVTDPEEIMNTAEKWVKGE